MRVLYYFLTGLFTLLGVLALLRTIELLITGAGMLPVQFLIGITMLVLAGGCLKNARNAITGLHMGRRRQTR
jgi:hypothetical protein